MEITYLAAVVWFAALSFLAGKLLSPPALGLWSRITSRTKSTLDDRIFSEIKGPIESFFFLFVFYAGIHFIPFYESSIPVVELYTSAAMVLVVTYLVSKVIKAVFHWYYEEGHQTSKVKIELSLLPLLQKIAQIFVIILGLMFTLAVLKFEITGLIAFTSLVGVILGFASQETLANLFAGLALQLDRIYHYGDYLRFPTGEVARLRKIGMRSTKLYDQSGKAIIVSNSEFAKMRLIKVGTPGHLVVNVAFEAPLNLKAEEIVSLVREDLVTGAIEGVHDIDKVDVVRLKVKAPGWYEGFVKVPVKDLADYVPIIDRINGVIIEAIERREKIY